MLNQEKTDVKNVRIKIVIRYLQGGLCKAQRIL